MARTQKFDRDIVVQKAREVFWKNGYESTSMQQLVDAMGINRSSIYNSFGGKLDLYREALRAYQHETNSYLRDALLDGDPMEALEELFDQAVSNIIGDKENKGCFNMNCRVEMAERDIDLKNWLRGTEEHNLDLFIGIIRLGQEKGCINKKWEAQDYARYVLSGYQGLRVSGILNKDEEQLRAVVSILLDRLR